ncbi:hypothetical protein K3495_g3927 [Podosphaera aphanis]|nr:hypothetical protein K3495_g3927 [Podosphaera aphanis]
MSSSSSILPRFLWTHSQIAPRYFQTAKKFSIKLSLRSITSCSLHSNLHQGTSCIYSKPLLSLRQSVNVSLSTTRIRSYSQRSIITRFEDLPEDYKDISGLPYRHSALSQKETRDIFGDVIDVGTADRVLRGLHGRRVAGTLEDPLYSNTFERQIIEKALKWLRKNVPVDEDLNAGLRAEKELAEIEANLVADAERIGLYKPNSGPKDSVYGEGAFDKLRKKNLEKMEIEEALKKEKASQADEVQLNSGTLESPSLNAKVELRQPGEHPWLKYYLERANVLPDRPPEMTTWQRLWPSGLLVIGVVTASLIFTQIYTPPKRDARIWPDMPVSAATIIGIIIANSTVFCMWRVPMLWRILNKYFITYPGFPRPLSLVGCFWSHQTIPHLTMNMLLLYVIGTKLHEEIGRGNFLALYFSAGVASGFFSLTCWALMKNLSSSSIGASGSIVAVITAYLLLSSSGENIKIFGVFPPDNGPSLTSLAILAFLISLDILALRKFHKTGKGLTVDHYGHLGGYATGAVWASFLGTNRTRRTRKRQESVE